jgi:hypothetical protein
MANTLPNVIVPKDGIVNLYTATGITAGTKISVRMIGEGEGQLFSGLALPSKPTDLTGFMPIYARESFSNEAGDLGAFIFSEHGCTVNVKVG